MPHTTPRIAFTALAALLILTTGAGTQPRPYPKAKVSFSDFKNLVDRVETERAKRLIDFDAFLAMAKQPGTIVLDSRSDFRFERLHLKGAKHLSFPDFTQQNLAAVIPDPQTPILIYCNNNFDGNQVDFAPKQFIPRPREFNQMARQAKPIMLALNVPTYINLYGYGYTNIYELNELLDVRDPRIAFEGTAISPPK